MGALTVARMREVEAEAGLTPAPKAGGKAPPVADAGSDAADAEFVQPPQAPAPQEVRWAADRLVLLVSVNSPLTCDWRWSSLACCDILVQIFMAWRSVLMPRWSDDTIEAFKHIFANICM